MIFFFVIFPYKPSILGAPLMENSDGPENAQFHEEVAYFTINLLGGSLPTNRKWVITPVIYMG